MAANGSVTTTMSPRDSLVSSQILSSSISSLSNSTSSRHSSSQISKIYRQASTLFLTRRLPESLSTILPVITPPEASNADGETSFDSAPIASASRTTRIKVWSLYLTILNAVVELDSDEGKQAFGSQEWRALVNKVREGQVWEDVVEHGYGGVEGDVDSDVVINLATLLLAHARTQTLNQQRLENYLAASSQPKLDISERLQASSNKRHSRRGPSPSKSTGTDTPRDLNARVKILELYTLHVLLRNNEWEYAREFITISEVLDEERRDAFLQALQSLQEDQAEQLNREQEAQQQQEEQLQKDIEDARQRRLELEKKEQLRAEQEKRPTSSNKASSEVDYGIDGTSADGTAASSAKSRLTKGPPKPSGGARMSHSSHASKSSMSKGSARPHTDTTIINRASALIANLQRLLEQIASSFKSNPMILLRTLAFMVVLILALSRRDIKDRLKQVLGDGWNKVRATAGMGVKVSYI